MLSVNEHEKFQICFQGLKRLMEKIEFVCPLCSDYFDIASLCCHIDDDHPIEAKSGRENSGECFLFTRESLLHLRESLQISDEILRYYKEIAAKLFDKEQS